MDTIGERLREERKRLKLSQVKFAEAGGVKKGAQIKYEANQRNPNAEYWAGVARIGADIQYILTNEYSVNLPSFEDKLKHLTRVTEQLTKIADSRPRRTDPMMLGSLRDLVYTARLNDDQIKIIFELLEKARKPDFWLDK